VASVRILHDIPGRLRLLFPGRADPREVVTVLEGQRGLLSWRWNQRTRSLLLLYDPGAISSEDLLDIVSSRLGAVAVRDLPQPARRTGPPALAVAVSQGLSELDTRMSSVTAGLVDVRLLFPLALFGWAMLELRRGAVGPLAWSSALWYAHGLFRDYNLPESSA